MTRAACRISCVIAIFARRLIRRRQSIRNGEVELRTNTGLRFSPDTAAAAFDNLLTNRQPYARTAIFAAMKAVERLENSIAVTHIESRTVVAHAKLPAGFLAFRAHPDLRRPRSPILQGVPDQVLHYLEQLRLIESDHGQIRNDDSRA